MGTALLRRIAREDEAKRQIAWDERAAQSRRRPKWAADHLLDTGQISPAQHDAAAALAVCIAVAAKPPPIGGSATETTIHAGWDLTMCAELHRIARACDPATAAQRARMARSWVLAAPRTTPKRIRLYDGLFAFPQVSWRTITGGHASRDDLAGQASGLMDVLIAFWVVYPPLPESFSR